MIGKKLHRIAHVVVLRVGFEISYAQSVQAERPKQIQPGSVCVWVCVCVCVCVEEVTASRGASSLKSYYKAESQQLASFCKTEKYNAVVKNTVCISTAAGSVFAQTVCFIIVTQFDF